MEHKKGSMIDNRKVGGNHQKGIERVKQRSGEGGRVGEPGKMTGKGHANWKRSGGATTPRKA
jgi:hypothetical protein